MPFADSTALAEATLRFLSDAAFPAETRRKAYAYAKPMFWPNVGRQYLDLFNRVVRASQGRRDDRSQKATAAPVHRGQLSLLNQGGRSCPKLVSLVNHR